MQKTLFNLAASALLLVAQAGATSACAWGWYEPEVPAALKCNKVVE
ncbi:MAG: cyclic lactone autoinducer peptide [Firmicutes bacterium]|nr:cyclic lactone autoinducer peptide [Bacillota bacterium]